MVNFILRPEGGTRLDKVIGLLKRDWRYFFLATFFLALGIVFGAAIYTRYPHEANRILKEVIEKLRSLTHPNPFIQMAIIFGNNLQSSLIAIFTGFFILPLGPFFIMFLNGMTIGILQQVLAIKAGISPYVFYLALSPHGIFELPAVIIASGLGLKLSWILMRLIWAQITGNDDKFQLRSQQFKSYFRDLRHYLLLVVIMLLIAAVVEVSISPILIKEIGLKSIIH